MRGWGERWGPGSEGTVGPFRDGGVRGVLGSLRVRGSFGPVAGVFQAQVDWRVSRFQLGRGSSCGERREEAGKGRWTSG